MPTTPPTTEYTTREVRTLEHPADLPVDAQLKRIRGLAYSRLEHTRRDQSTVKHRDVLTMYHYDIGNDTAYKRMRQAAEKFEDIEYVNGDRPKRLLLDPVH